MKLYRKITDIPELSNLSSEEAERIWTIAYRRSFRHWQTWLAFLLAVLLIPAVMGFVAIAVIPASLGFKAVIYCFLMGGIPSGVAFVFAQYAAIDRARPYMAALRSELNA